MPYSLHGADSGGDFQQYWCNNETSIIDRFRFKVSGSILSIQDSGRREEWLNFELPAFEKEIRTGQAKRNHCVETESFATSDGKTTYIFYDHVFVDKVVFFSQLTSMGLL